MQMIHLEIQDTNYKQPNEKIHTHQHTRFRKHTHVHIPHQSTSQKQEHDPREKFIHLGMKQCKGPNQKQNTYSQVSKEDVLIIVVRKDTHQRREDVKEDNTNGVEIEESWIIKDTFTTVHDEDTECREDESEEEELKILVSILASWFSGCVIFNVGIIHLQPWVDLQFVGIILGHIFLLD